MSDHPQTSAKAYTLFESIQRYPTRFGAWQAAVQLGTIKCPDIIPELKKALYSPDPYTRECCLETLAMKQDPEIIGELETVFQNGNYSLTKDVVSIARLRTKSTLPDEFYKDLDGIVRESTKRVKIDNLLDLVDAVPDVALPVTNRQYAAQLIRQIYTNPNFFKDLTEDDIKLLNAMFRHEFIDPNRPKGYKTIKLWDFEGPNGSPSEPYDQPLVGPSPIPYVMISLVKKFRGHVNEHPLKFIGEEFYHQNIIHPFWDGNGRTNFLIMNLFLLHSQLPYVRMVDGDLLEYYRTLNLPEPTEFVRFLGELLKR